MHPLQTPSAVLLLIDDGELEHLHHSVDHDPGNAWGVLGKLGGRIRVGLMGS